MLPSMFAVNFATRDSVHTNCINVQFSSGMALYENLNGVWWPQHVNNHSTMVVKDIGGGAIIHPHVFTNPLENFLQLSGRRLFV